MELSKRQQDDLLVLKARKGENLQPLTKLAVRSVARNIDYFASMDNPFECLPRTVLEDMLRYPPLAPLLRCPKYAHLMVCSLTKHAGTVVLDFTSSRVTWTEEDVERVCSLIEESSVIVRRLVIYLQQFACWPIPEIIPPQLTTARLHELLKHLPNLETFRCEPDELRTHWLSGVSNETLEELATNCPKLRVLTVPGLSHCRNNDFTKETMTALCAACPGLEVFDITLPRTCTWDQNLEFVLPLVPRLWRMQSSYKLEALQPDVMITYLKRHGPTHPQLRYALRYPQKPHLVEAVDTIAQCFPRCQELHATDRSSNLDLTPALKFKELRKVVMENIEEENNLKDTFPVLLAENSLTDCRLYKVKNYSLDLSLIAHHCPELDSLGVGEIEISKNQQYPIQPYHFQSLTRVHLWKLTLPPVALHTVAKILSSPRLVLLYVSSITLPDVVFSSLVQEARQERQVFSSLEDLYLEKCRVHPETLIDVLLQAPRLQKLRLSEVDKEHYESVAKFVKEHMKHVQLEWED